MKRLNFILIFTVMVSSCSMMKKKTPTTSNTKNSQSTQVQTENLNKEAHEKAASLTQGWPESSITAAKEMLVKHGEPTEVTNDELIWKYAPPFKKIIVHKEVYSNRFPLLHQNAVEHFTDYKAPISRVEEALKYNGSLSIDPVRGQISASGENEAQNILSLNLVHEVLQGRIGPSQARVQHGKETMNFLNGLKNPLTQTLTFGNQINTVDTGETVTKKIRWVNDAKKEIKPNPNTRTNMNMRQAEEEKPQ